MIHGFFITTGASLARLFFFLICMSTSFCAIGPPVTYAFDLDDILPASVIIMPDEQTVIVATDYVHQLTTSLLLFNVTGAAISLSSIYSTHQLHHSAFLSLSLRSVILLHAI
jgi:hypothetical protein